MTSKHHEEERMVTNDTISTSKNSQQRIIDSSIVGSVITSGPATDLQMGAQKRVPGSRTTDA